jgi:hypothetical protein
LNIHTSLDDVFDRYQCIVSVERAMPFAILAAVRRLDAFPVIAIVTFSEMRPASLPVPVLVNVVSLAH